MSSAEPQWHSQGRADVRLPSARHRHTLQDHGYMG